jgi:nucleoside-diphosphate-sugar epimerase
VSRLLVLGAGYLGAALARRALAAGDEVVLADNWHATRREQLAPLAAAGAVVVEADVRRRADVERVLARGADRVVLLAAQASRPRSWTDPDYTEATNVTGARLVAETVGAAGGPAVTFGSSLHVYGGAPVAGPRPYGPQGDLAHLSKVYGELVLRMHLERAGVPLALLRLGIVYGPSPVEHDAPESVTVVDTFRRRAARGEPLRVDDPAATIGVAHVDDVARILHEHVPAGVEALDVAAEAVTVGDLAALAQGREPAGGAAWAVSSPFAYEHRVAEYLRA